MKNTKLYFAIAAAIFTVCCFSVVYAVTQEPNIMWYGCDNGQIQFTEELDSNGDGIYDTYVVHWCDGVEKKYTLEKGFKGIDIDKTIDDINDPWNKPWAKPDPKKQPPKPPKKGQIVFADPFTRAMIENVYDTETGLLSWWYEKPVDIDTAFINIASINPRISINENNDGNSSNMTILPNPNDNTVAINLSVSEPNRVVINLYNQQGIMVAGLLNADEGRGDYQMQLNTAGLSNGLYFIHSRIGNSVSTHKLLLAR